MHKIKPDTARTNKNNFKGIICCKRQCVFLCELGQRNTSMLHTVFTWWIFIMMDFYMMSFFICFYLIDFWRSASSVLNKSKSAVLPLFNAPEVLSSASAKAKLFAKNFSRNSNSDDSGNFLPVSPSTCISWTLKLVKKVVTKLQLPKAFGPNLISVGRSKELCTWTFIHSSWTLQYVSEEILFYKLLEGLISGPCI